MNDIDDLGRALADLAARADGTQPSDRIERIHRRARRTARLRGVAVTVAAVVLSGSATALVARAHNTPGPQTPAAAPTSTASNTTPATGPSPTATTSPNGAGSTCLTNELSVRLGVAQGAAGSTYRPIVFTNTSAHPCTMGGYPGVAFIDTHTGQQVGTPASRGSQQTPRAIRLAPGASASAVLQVVNPFNYPTGTCRPQPVTAVRVYPPGNTTATDLPLAGAATACSTGVTQLQVQATVPGSTGQ